MTPSCVVLAYFVPWSDHGTQFSKKFTGECKRLHIRHWKSSVAHPQGNGQGKTANKLVLAALKKNLEGKSNKWIDELNSVLWVVRTSTRGPTAETPYSLVYGSKAVAPAELALPTHRVNCYNLDVNLVSRAIDLDLLDERQKVARLRMETYKQQRKASHDKRVRRRPLQVGDWVLQKIDVTGRQMEATKLTPNWEGPYIIISEVRPGTFRLKKEDDTVLANPWHSDHLKKYYV